MIKKVIQEKVIDSGKISVFIWENKLTKKEFAQMCGISTNVLRKILKGYINFKASAIFKVAKIMKVHLKELFL